MRAATAILIVVAGLTVGYAQQLEVPPFYPPTRQTPLRSLFPTAPPDSPLPSLPLSRAQQPGTPQLRTPQPVTPQRSGSVCLKTVPVDPSSDRAFVRPVPDTRSLPMRIIEMPPCVTLAPPQAR